MLLVHRRTALDPLSRAMQAHALADDQRREAERLVGALRQRANRAEAAAAERRARGEEALRRGEEAPGLSLLDAALEAQASARQDRRRLVRAERQARQLALVERAHRAHLFRHLGLFLSALEAPR